MATGSDIVLGAYQKLGLKPADSDITGQEMLDAIIVLNDMMMEFENSGVTFGYSPIGEPSDTIRVPIGTENGIKATLAGYLAPNLDVAISATLAAQIEVSQQKMFQIIRKPINTRYPDTLPLGSGNDCDDFTLFNDRFFPPNEKENF